MQRSSYILSRCLHALCMASHLSKYLLCKVLGTQHSFSRRERQCFYLDIRLLKPSLKPVSLAHLWGMRNEILNYFNFHRQACRVVQLPLHLGVLCAMAIMICCMAPWSPGQVTASLLRTRFVGPRVSWDSGLAVTVRWKCFQDSLKEDRHVSSSI